jgi:undecaprenyl diphosphate synthase
LLHHYSGDSKNRVSQSESLLKIPVHVAVIMDGNGRWAKAQGKDRIEGHKSGAHTVRMIVEESRRLNVRFLTLFTFSSENWNRPPDEVDGLMQLLCEYLRSEIELLTKHAIRLRAIGDLSKLSPKVVNILQDVQEKTAHFKGMDLILALSYGGRAEIVYAVKNIVMKALEGDIVLSDIDEDLVNRYMYAPDIPAPDLLIRTSNEYRISNFLLWQLAYSEIVVSDKMWPEFSKEDFIGCLECFSNRKRRFGLTDEQIIKKA